MMQFSVSCKLSRNVGKSQLQLATNTLYFATIAFNLHCGKKTGSELGGGKIRSFESIEIYWKFSLWLTLELKTQIVTYCCLSLSCLES